jgi:glycosyltransferase involved in cell wall biosynthesis
MESAGISPSHLAVAVDARTAYAPQRGIGKTLVSTYEALARIRPGWSFSMLYRERREADPFPGHCRIAARRIRLPEYRWNLWQRLGLPLTSRMLRADVLHCPANSGPPRPLVPMVLTVHDLIPLRLAPESPKTEHWLRQVKSAALAARCVTTPSEFSKSDLVHYLGIAPEKIVVNPWAPDPLCHPPEDPDRVRSVAQKYGLYPDQRYVLGFGGIDPRKNTRRILEAYARLPRATRCDVQLAVLGIRQPLLAQLEELARELRVEGTCRLHGYIADEEMISLLGGATVMCFPSLCEGFGLPVLDAFACGTAVLASNTTSVPEVAGDAALLIEPQDTAAITDGLCRLLDDEAFRRTLAWRGRERAKRFTWNACAERLASAMEEAARKSTRSSLPPSPPKAR